MSQNIPKKINHFSSKQEASIALAQFTTDILKTALEKQQVVTVALTGGSSPSEIYKLWGQKYATKLDWSKVHFFWGDERRLAPGDQELNTALAETLFSRLKVKKENIHAWNTTLAPHLALQAMKEAVRKFHPYRKETFTLTLLGVGEDGHVASLFPKDFPWLDGKKAYPAMARYINNSPKPPSERFTFSLPYLSRSEHILLLPLGAKKQSIVKRIAADDESLPASYLFKLEQTSCWTSD